MVLTVDCRGMSVSNSTKYGDVHYLGSVQLAYLRYSAMPQTPTPIRPVQVPCTHLWQGANGQLFPLADYGKYGFGY